MPPRCEPWGFIQSSMKRLRLRYFAIFTSLAVLAGVVSCDKNGKTEEDLSYVTLTSPSVGHAKGQQFVKAYAPGEWTLTIVYPDLEADSEEGGWAYFSNNQNEPIETIAGAGEVVNLRLSYAQNFAEIERQLHLVLLYAGGEKVATLTQQPESNGGGGEEPGITNPTVSWAELPNVETTATRKFIAHYAPNKSGMARNFSMLFDTEAKIALWVAFPQNPAYLGGGGRSNGWKFDPLIKPNTDQASLASSYKPIGNGHDRGHQIASGDRTYKVDDAYLLNRQTFYYTNMTPQVAGLNQNGWANLEDWIRTKVSSSEADTLYVVTGAVLQTVGGNEVIKYVYDNAKPDGLPVAIPNYYYKVLLDYRGGVYQKAIGFWYPQQAASGGPTSANTKKVSDIEALTGLTFFNNVPQAQVLKTQYSPSQWGL